MFYGDRLAYCHLRSSISQGFGHTDVVLSEINSQTPVSRFQDISRIYNSYKPQSANITGWNALCTAAYNGNAQLAEHIINLYKKDIRLVDLATTFGWTPLFCASVSTNHQGALAVSELLIKEEANVNIATPYVTSLMISDVANGLLNKSQGIPSGATPLWGSLFVSKNVQLSRYLESQGGKYLGAPVKVTTTSLA
jgi:hypothetical protein